MVVSQLPDPKPEALVRVVVFLLPDLTFKVLSRFRAWLRLVVASSGLFVLEGLVRPPRSSGGGPISPPCSSDAFMLSLFARLGA